MKTEAFHMSDIKELAAAAKEASFLTATLDSDLKNSSPFKHN